MVVGAFITRWTDRFKTLQELRADAYVDFIRGVSELAILQSEATRDGESFLAERNSKMTVASAKARIAIYGGKNVVRALSTFLNGGAVLNTSERLHKFAELCELMRKESNSQKATFEDIHKLLFR